MVMQKEIAIGRLPVVLFSIYDIVLVPSKSINDILKIF